MSRELFFIPILAGALKGPDVQQALENAFATIKQMGHEADYEEGYGNFKAFMAEVNASRNILHEQDVRMAILMSAAGDTAETQEWEKVVEAEICQNTELKAECDALRRALGLRPRVPVLQLLQDGRQIGQVTFETVPDRHAIDGIRPGRYALRTDTGLVVWEGELTAKDLIWTDAFGGSDLALAAEAGEVRRRASREVEVADANLTLRLFPGIESGSIEMELTR